MNQPWYIFERYDLWLNTSHDAYEFQQQLPPFINGTTLGRVP